MADPFLGQIEIFGFNFPPKRWAACNGQLLAINQNAALFSLLGTTFGGNGQTTFALPDLRGRVPVGVGKDFQQVAWVRGQVGGTETVALTSDQIPPHTHLVWASSAAAGTSNTAAPSATVGLGQTSGHDDQGAPMTVNLYVPDAAPAAVLGASAVSSTPAAQPHENRMPLLVLNICICLAGVFPSRN
jgi:microcystin-dependent protein